MRVGEQADKYLSIKDKANLVRFVEDMNKELKRKQKENGRLRTNS